MEHDSKFEEQINEFLAEWKLYVFAVTLLTCR